MGGSSSNATFTDFPDAARTDAARMMLERTVLHPLITASTKTAFGRIYAHACLDCDSEAIAATAAGAMNAVDRSAGDRSDCVFICGSPPVVCMWLRTRRLALVVLGGYMQRHQPRAIYKRMRRCMDSSFPRCFVVGAVIGVSQLFPVAFDFGVRHVLFCDNAEFGVHPVAPPVRRISGLHVSLCDTADRICEDVRQILRFADCIQATLPISSLLLMRDSPWVDRGVQLRIRSLARLVRLSISHCNQCYRISHVQLIIKPPLQIWFDGNLCRHCFASISRAFPDASA